MCSTIQLTSSTKPVLSRLFSPICRLPLLYHSLYTWSLRQRPPHFRNLLLALHPLPSLVLSKLYLRLDYLPSSHSATLHYLLSQLPISHAHTSLSSFSILSSPPISTYSTIPYQVYLIMIDISLLYHPLTIRYPHLHYHLISTHLQLSEKEITYAKPQYKYFGHDTALLATSLICYYKFHHTDILHPLLISSKSNPTYISILSDITILSSISLLYSFSEQFLYSHQTFLLPSF